jgi:hypothetical protein
MMSILNGGQKSEKKYSSLPFHYKIPKKNNELPRVGKRKT